MVYKYSVNGIEYQAGRFSFGFHSHDAHKIFAQYKAGKPVKVYHSPRNPRLAVLKPGLRLFDYLQLLIGLVGLFFVVKFLLQI